jgi:hypothetical protein
MQPSVRSHGRLVVVELSGELGITAASALGAALSAAVEREPVIEVDLSPRRDWPGEALPFWVMRWTV